jgi:CRISPR-associated protein Csc2
MMDTLFEQLRKEVKVDYTLAKEPFAIPALPQAQCIVIPIIREAIAPILIRNNDSDTITDILANDKLRVRMIASKTKGVERRRGSQILRTLGKGGKAATNKGFISEKKGILPSHVFDLNSFVFGDSVQKEQVYQVHASVLYSDALSIQPKNQLTDTVFRQGGISEEFSNFEADEKKTSSNVFNTRSVVAGAVFVQSLVMTGHHITREAFNHLLLSIGLAGSYGGSTATTGTNLKTHLCGVYWGAFEKSINAPQEMLAKLEEAKLDVPLIQEKGVIRNIKLNVNGKKEKNSENCIIRHLEQTFQNEYPFHISVDDLENHVATLLKAFEDANGSDYEHLEKDYEKAAKEVADLFDCWFLKPKKVSSKKATDQQIG